MSAGKRTPRELAEACFAIARRTSFAGERDAAIGRGLEICVRYGLSPDAFDIPGRQRASRRPPPPPSGPAPDTYSAEELRRTMERFYRTIEEQAAAVGAAEGETVWDARVRNFHRANAEAAERDRQRAARGGR